MSDLNQPTVKVRLIRSPSIWVEGNPQPIAIRGLGRVLLYLILLQGESVSRSSMARTLWPDEPNEVAGNRLRVSLNRAKAIFGSTLSTDRQTVCLKDVTLNLDLQDRLVELQEVLDEVDPSHQFQLLMGFCEDFKEAVWRSFTELDSSGILTEWEAAGRTAMNRLLDHAVQMSDWETVDLVWDLICQGGAFDQKSAERLLDAFSARGSIEEGMRKIRAVAREAGIHESDAVFQGLKKYAKTLKDSGAKNQAFQAAHFNLLGGALLNQLDRHAEELASLIILPEMQLSMQAVPSAYLQILEQTLNHLDPGTMIWIKVQGARLSFYASLYDHEGVFEVCHSLFRYNLTPRQASTSYMHYSFSLFQLRRWQEAIDSVHKAQQLALEADETQSYEICRITEAAYLWHLGQVEEAGRIYDDYLAKYAESKDFTMKVNALICRLNYAVIELVFGNIHEARKHVEYVYGQRLHFNLGRIMPTAVCLMAVIYARTNDLHLAVQAAIEGLKLTYARSSTREGQLNMEWACGVLAVGGLRYEAWHVMYWVNEWRKETHHTRSICEERFFESLGLKEFEGNAPMFKGTDAYREVMQFLIKCLRRVQNGSETKSGSLRQSLNMNSS